MSHLAYVLIFGAFVAGLCMGSEIQRWLIKRGGGTVAMHMRQGKIVATTLNGQWLCQGMQLRERLLVPRWLGRLILWLFFHRLDTETEVVLGGFASPVNQTSA